MITKQGTDLKTMAAGFAALALLMINGAGQAAPITEPEANAIAVDAYVYFYSLVTMDITRQQLVNVAHPEGIHAPMNTFANIPAYPTAGMRAVVRPNFDTLYSSAWVDLTREPVVISAPATDGRYYLPPMLDAPLWAQVRGAHRRMESAAGGQSRGTGPAAGTVILRS